MRRNFFVISGHFTALGTLFYLGYLMIKQVTVFENVNAVTLSAQMILMLLLFILTMRTEKVMVTFSLAASFVLFLQYGFIVEVSLTTLTALLALILKGESRKFIYSFYIISYFWTSFLSAKLYDWLSHYDHGLGWHMVYIARIGVYMLMYYLISKLFVLMLGYIKTGKWPIWFKYQKKWELLTALLCIPFAFLMYTMMETFEMLGFVFIAIPLIIFSYIFRVYHSLNELNAQLAAISEISNSFTSELYIKKVIDTFLSVMQEIFPYDNCFIYEFADKNKPILKLMGSRATRDPLHFMRGEIHLTTPKTVPLMADTLRSWKNELMEVFVTSPATEVKVLPMTWNQSVRGLVVLVFFKPHAMKRRKQVLAEILIRHLEIASHNAKKYEMTTHKSRTDELTGLINYRHFETKLHYEMRMARQNQEHLSLILIDIDYFKKINDTYGHLAGDEVLRTLAQLYKKLCPAEATIARYGGEEFTILLPRTTSKTAFHIAENIRKTVEQTPIRVTHSLQALESSPVLEGEGQPQSVQIHATLSMGVAAYPTHADDANSLVRFADRAMYTGAKQEGRNKVAIYKN